MSKKGLVGRVVSYLNEPYAGSKPKDLAVRLGATGAGIALIIEGAKKLAEYLPTVKPISPEEMYFYTHTVTAPPGLIPETTKDPTGMVAATIAAVTLVPLAIVYVENKYGSKIKAAGGTLKEKMVKIDDTLGAGYDRLMKNYNKIDSPAVAVA